MRIIKAQIDVMAQALDRQIAAASSSREQIDQSDTHTLRTNLENGGIMRARHAGISFLQKVFLVNSLTTLW